MANVPLPSGLPIGQRLMHDTYLFIYLMCTFIAVKIARKTSDPKIRPSQVRGSVSRFIGGLDEGS